MYFWKIESLTQELKAGGLPQSERVKYLLATVIVYSVVLESSFFFAEPITFLQILQSAFMFVITIAGTLYCYVVNRRGDNQEFIDRFVCVGWVVLVRITALFVVVYFPYVIAGHAIGGEKFERFSESINVVDVTFTLFICALSYWLIGRHINRIAHE